ncbi:MAG: type II secretion system protein [Planctomyces sp.]
MRRSATFSLQYRSGFASSTLRSSADRNRSGFTLLEMLIVLGIILVIAAMVVPNLVGAQQGANEKATMASIKQVESVTKQYAVDHDGSFYTGNGTDAWQAFIKPEPYRGRNIRPYYEEPPVDAWGNVLHYEWDGKGHSKASNALKPAVWSSGPDGKDDSGSGDDINNWTSAQASK